MNKLFAVLTALSISLGTTSVAQAEEYFGAMLGLNTAISGDWSPKDMEFNGGFQANGDENFSAYVRFLAAPLKGSAGAGFGFGFSPRFLKSIYTIGMGFEGRGWYKDADGAEGPEMIRLFTTLRGRASLNTFVCPEMSLGIESSEKLERGHIFFRAGWAWNIDRFLAY